MNRHIVLLGHMFIVFSSFDSSTLWVCCKQKGQTPLHYASKYGQVEVIKFLLDKGSDANRACGYGRTPLHYASRHDQAAAAKALCSVGDIKIDAQDKVRSEVRMG
eukprot:9494304-Pyramimonas_sp.AAC.3